MIHTQFDYDYHQVLASELIAQTFHSLVMAAMVRGDSANKAKLSWAFPDIADDMISRGHVDIPRPARAAAAAPVIDAAMLEQGWDNAQLLARDLAAALDGELDVSWAPVLITVLRAGHPELWQQVKAVAEDQAKKAKEKW